jgi:MYXO-CTERM domain-containing protein
VALLGLSAAALPAGAATQVAFTVNGTVTAAVPGLGYTGPSAVSFTWVLDDVAAAQARFSGPAACCGGTLAWFQDLFSSTPQLWTSITGSRLSGAWLPPTNRDDGSVFLSVGNFPQPYPASFGLLANAQIGFTTGLEFNGQPVAWLQMNAVYTGLDALGTLGSGALFGATPPDPTALFLGLVGTYDSDPIFTREGTITAWGPQGGQFRFRIDSLTISAVPEPDSWALALAGAAFLGALSRRRRQHDRPGPG